MRRGSTKISLSLMLIVVTLSMVLSVFNSKTVFAAVDIVCYDTTIQTISLEDLMKMYKNVDYKPYMCVSSKSEDDPNAALCYNTDYKYFFALQSKETNQFLYYHTREDDNGNTIGELVVCDIAKVLGNKANFNKYSGSYGYCSVNTVSDLNKFLTENNCRALIFCYDGNEVLNLGVFDSFDTVKKENSVASFIKEPAIDVSTDKVDNSTARITVKYKEGNKYSSIRNIVLYVDKESTSNEVKVSNISDAEGSVTYEVNSNATYYVSTFLSPYLTPDASHYTKPVTIDFLTATTLADDAAAAANTDTKEPTITFSAFPESALTDTSTELTMYSDEPAILNFNGVASDGYVTEMKINVSENGDYFYSASDKSGNIASNTLKVEFFEDNVMSNDDRDSFWGEPITSILPQTGSTGFYSLILVGIVLIGGGAFFIYKSRKKKSEVSSDSEVKTDDKEITSSEE